MLHFCASRNCLVFSSSGDENFTAFLKRKKLKRCFVLNMMNFVNRAAFS